jgi:hypothetical protein
MIIPERLTSQNLTFAIIPERSHIAPLSHLRYDGEIEK